MRQLLRETQVYRVDNEQEAIELIEQFKQGGPAGGYDIKKSGYENKTKKAKGEIVETWTVTTITKEFGE